MKKKKPLLIFATIIPLVLVLALVAFLSNNKLEPNGQNPDTEEPVVEAEYMTKEEVIELFYDNYNTFNEVAEYILNTEGAFYCDNNSNILLLSNGREDGRDVLDIDNLKIGEEIKALLYDLNFNGIYEYEVETGSIVKFENNFADTSAKGILYAESRDAPDLNNLGFDEYAPLDIENWYYYYIPIRG